MAVSKKGVKVTEQPTLADVVALLAQAQEILESFTEEADETPAPAAKKSAEKPTAKKSGKNKQYTKKELEEMEFNALRALGSELGVKVGGKRPEIIANILNSYKDGADEDEPVADKKGGKAKKAAPAEKGKKELEPAEEEYDEDELKETLEEMSEKELKELLQEHGLKAIGKKSVLIDRIIAAVAEGKIEIESDDEAEDEPEDSAEEGDEEEFDVYAEFEDFGYNNPEEYEFTPEREAKLNELDTVLAEEGLGMNDKSLNALIIKFFGKDFSSKLVDYDKEQKEIIATEIMKLYVDDNGEVVVTEESDPEAYYVNDELFCCGYPVDTSDPKTGICGKCGEEYEVE